MRLTLYIDAGKAPHEGGFPLNVEHRYAVLWLDLDHGIWSREAHQGIELPSWGTLHDAPEGMQLRSQEDKNVLCMLHGLTAAARRRHDAAGGTASWTRGTQAALGRWHLQAVDTEQIKAEHEIFKGEPNATSDL